MSAPTPACSVCSGPLLVGHPAGLVVRHALTCPRLAAEDGRQAGDWEMRDTVGDRFTRPATSTERVLLAELHGVGWPPPDRPDAELLTHVEWLSPGVRRRTWPQVRVLA